MFLILSFGEVLGFVVVVGFFSAVEITEERTEPLTQDSEVPQIVMCTLMVFVQYL